MSVEETNDNDVHCTALVDENHLSLAMTAMVVRLVQFNEISNKINEIVNYVWNNDVLVYDRKVK